MYFKKKIKQTNTLLRTVALVIKKKTISAQIPLFSFFLYYNCNNPIAATAAAAAIRTRIAQKSTRRNKKKLKRSFICVFVLIPISKYKYYYGAKTKNVLDFKMELNYQGCSRISV